MNSPRHEMILASAGSGKTYALTNRFVELLARGAAPERIVALTFTRKAAGEFFDEILQKLARAASDEEVARKLARDLGVTLDGGAARRMLRQVIDAMPRLRLGTLDGFFGRIVRSFPLELGLAGEFEILPEHAARVERRRILRRMYARSGGQLVAAQNEFIEAFKRATFGTEEKQLGARLDSFLDQHQETFLSAPQAVLWGDAARIWPEGSPWLAEEIKLKDAVQELRQTLGEMNAGQRLRWENFFLALDEWTPGAPLPAPVEYILKNALLVWRAVGEGRAEIMIERRKLPLSAAACRALEKVITHLVGAELRRRLETTRGIFAVLRGYEIHYHDAVRRAGRLTFADVQRLLAPESGAPALSAKVISNKDKGSRSSDSPGEGSERDQQLLLLDPSRLELAAADDERRLLLDYRLDAAIDHWLLDEFQDTSFGQWSILRNLIDEVVQDPTGARTFFCVGDVKQAIYAWREGDPRLFREILEHYNSAAADTIVERSLVDSWRSGPALIEMVNAVFGAAPVLTDLFPGAASATWIREWRNHRSAVPERIGQASLLHAADEAERWATTLRVVQEIEPLKRGMTCAILVKRNDTAATLADYLRHAGIAALAESDLHIAIDNPLGTALLALFQAAAHPGDTLAQEHVRMTPLSAVLQQNGLSSADLISRRLLEHIHAEGFERTVEFWVRQLEPKLSPDDAFSRERAREFVAAAGLFDATGSRDIDEFVAFMERHTVRPPEAGAIVRVMTIHKSKGLGFDVVILPDLQGTRIDERRDGLAVEKARDRSIQWILDLPPRLFCAEDEVLAAHLQRAEADACYENLSLLYVAMTRAKRAMYIVTEPVGDSKSRNFPRVLADTLGAETRDVRIGKQIFAGAWSSGDPQWHLAVEEQSTVAAPGPQPMVARLLHTAAATPTRRIARRPSAGSERVRSAGAFFSLESADAAEFGTAVHARLAEIEWLDSDAVSLGAGAAESAEVRMPTQPSNEVKVAVDACLRSPVLAPVWQRPTSPQAEVWRERVFEIVLDDAWITGVFDRVVVECDQAGRPLCATVYDFKTDRPSGRAAVEAAISRYTPQLDLYRRVVAVLTALPVAAVRCELVFTHLRERAVIPVPDQQP
jgi:ATP-dependent helicase/nuclease subunit A